LNHEGAKDTKEEEGRRRKKKEEVDNLLPIREEINRSDSF
jgi:hypothetical protein